jgi:N-acetylmuramoyl-L-alanine amidase
MTGIAGVTVIHRASPNHEPRPAATRVDMLVLHYTGMQNAEAALTRLCDPASGVSAHYLVDEDGAVYALVAEDRRAWHAGVSCWRGHRDVNGRSIGVELVNPGHAFGYRPFPAAQMEALSRLAQGIVARHPIAPRNVVGHSDVAPLRKMDPGELFDWRWLAGHGVGLWPQPAAAPIAESAASLLRTWGYDVPDAEAEHAALVAFQRHFRPARCDGVADAETLSLLHALARLVA